ncbi:glutamyl-tRNA reductase [Natronogracilivirga saccharolytica]|uniref:Glutamyl-tRNA reductase n=1 Tax=Natronogracilivirga saccharolytica TaxID=2812953 RepID=A0A8J7SAG9_9BACT|nr:glutamyl-tRNA reductase [Natronogracilivirga saccharolytica]MBP3193433.1 glutamyl-tRNA reductase [Natronogracilivirga saccharolytica]
MNEITPQITEFSAIGINHWKADVALRERFSLSGEQKEAFLEDARVLGLRDVIIVSTCNRTEIFARNNTPGILVELLVKHSDGSREEFDQYGFLKEGEESVRHLLRVTVGLDAQILGDLQIVKQVKEAYEYTHSLGMADAMLHRLMQFVLRTHKRSRTETDLASGAATTAYAAVQFAQKRLKSLKDKNILLVGTGKIGKITCKNLISMGARNVTLLNRSRERAENLGDRFQLPVAGLEEINIEMGKADLVIVATGADKPVIGPEQLTDLEGTDKKVVMLDLSVPRNIDPAAEQHPNIELVNMDRLNDTTDEAYRRRERNIPKVEAIIDEEIANFRIWLSEQKVVPTIRALNDKLHDIRSREIEKFRAKLPDSSLGDVEHLTRRIVNKIMAHSIDHLKDNHEAPEEITRLVNSMFKLEPESDLDN